MTSLRVIFIAKIYISCIPNIITNYSNDRMCPRVKYTIRSNKEVAQMSEQITLVLGGGQYGIAWEIGLLKGLADHGIELRLSEQIIGTSAGSQVGAVIASNKTWEEIWNEQIDEEINEVNPNLIWGSIR